MGLNKLFITQEYIGELDGNWKLVIKTWFNQNKGYSFGDKPNNRTRYYTQVKNEK